MAKELDNQESRAAQVAEREAPRAALDWTEAGELRINLTGDWERFLMASGHDSVADGLISQAATLGSRGNRIDPKATDFTLGFVDAMQPQDAAEALLLTQMAAIHQATIMLARRLNHVENIPQQDAAEKALNKLARSYAAQMDTFKRYRSKGQQVVRVERVTVEEGGQAIVGNVEHGGRGSYEK
ncbi:MAG: hypothetical protein ACU0DX_14055 [Roseovarius sp.]|uniref:hypothetical protein n=1 Tax=Roseovarius sp. TaxID=1486281 RepID=UPI00405801F7